MSAIVLSTAYFPNIQYCNVLHENAEVTIDHGEHFIKQSQRSRCTVLGANGPLKLIVPLIKWKNNTPVKDVKIAYDQNWQKLHWKTLESAYRTSPYFEYYEDKLNAVINKSHHKFLIDLNQEALNFVLYALDIEPKINRQDTYVEFVDKGNDFRNTIYDGASGKNEFKNYTQVFGKNQFYPNLSSLDLICNEGPNGIHLLH